MKKVVALILALVVMSSAGLFAYGIGLQGGGGVAGGGTAVTFKLDELPYVFAANFGFYGVGTYIGVTADRWHQNDKIAMIAEFPLNWYWGYGAYLGLTTWSSSADFAVGARAPVGLNMFIMDGTLEFYTQIALQIGVKFGDSVGFDWGIDGSGGFRWWFK